MTGHAATTIGATLALLSMSLSSCSPPSGGEQEDGALEAQRDRYPPHTGNTGAVAWTNYRGDGALTGVASGRLPDQPQLLWTFETQAAIASSAVVADGNVFFGSDDGKVYCVDLETGAEAWSFETEDIVEAPPLVHDGVVYVGASDFHLYALNASDGQLVWKRETDDKIVGSANVAIATDGAADRIIFGSYDNSLHCLDAATGNVIWTYETENYINGTPAIVGDRVIFGGCDAAVHIVSVADGTPLARIELGEECQVAASAAIVGDRAYLGHNGNAFVCVDLEKLEIVWEYTSNRFGFFSSPSVGADRVVFGGRDKALHCAAREDGAPIWTFPTRRKVDGSPVICGDRVVFGSGDGRLYIVDLESGAEIWSHDIGQSIFSSPAVAGGVILIGSNDGRMYAFGPSPSSSPGETKGSEVFDEGSP